MTNHEAGAAVATLNEALSALLSTRAQLLATQEAAADLQSRLDTAEARVRELEAARDVSAPAKEA